MIVSASRSEVLCGHLSIRARHQPAQALIRPRFPNLMKGPQKPRTLMRATGVFADDSSG